MEPVRLAVCGFGLVGKRHAEAIAACDGAILAAVVEPGDGAATSGAWVWATLDGLLAKARPDGIILATPTPLHAAQALACIDAGVPVLIEKPIADTCDAAAPVVHKASVSGVPVLVGHHRRHNPLIHAAKAAIDAGRIGDIRAVQATCWLYKPDGYFDVAPWRKAPGAGPVSVNLAHDIDLLRHLCGEVAGVQARAAPSRRGYQNEDLAAALLTFENGAIGTVTVSDSIAAPWSWELTAGENPVYAKTDQSCYKIGGSAGSLSVPDLRVWTHEGEPDWWAPMNATSLASETADPLVNQIAHFADVIRGRAEPLVSAIEGFRTLQVIEAIQRSARTGETVVIER